MTINLRPHGVVTRRVVSALPANIGIQTDSHLTEDFILTDEIPVDPPSAAGASSVAPFLNPAINQSEALIIQNGELFYVCREPLSNSGWNFFGLGAGFPFIAPMNAAGGWAFANDGSVWQNVAGAWNAPATGPVPTATGTGTDGTIWGIVGGNVVVFDTTSLQWIDPPDLVNNAIPYVSIPSGSVDNLWVAEAGYFPVVYHYDPTNGWQNIVLNYENVPTTTEMVSVSVGFDARVFAVDNTAISSTAAWALSLAPKLMYVTLDESLQCKYEQVEGPFQLTGGAYTPSIALGVDQTLWLTDSFGTVWKYLPTSSVQWQRQMTPPAVSGTTEGWNIGDGAAMADSAGTVHAFCTCGGNRTGLYVTTLQNGDWRQPALVDVSGASASTTYGPLGIQRDATTGDVVVFAAASNGQLMLTRTGAVTNGVLLGSEQQFAPGQKLQLIQQNPDIWGVAGIVDNAVWSAIGTPADPTSTSGWVPPPSSPFNKATGIVADADTDSPITFVLDGWQNLWAWPDVTTLMTAEELTGTADSPFSGVSTVAVTVSPLSGMRTVFAADSSGSLWILRQTGGGDTPTWTSWHPLGDPCSAIAGGAGTAGVPELWFVDTGLTSGAPSLNLLTQNPINLNWTTQPVVKPKQAADTPQATASYVTQIALINQDSAPAGVPVPGAPVTISTVEPVVVTVEGQQYTIAPNQPQTFITDEFGRVTLTTPALSLHTAALTIAAPNAAGALVYPPALAHATLQNTTDLATAQYTTTTVPTPVQANLVQSNASHAPDVLSATNDVFTIQQANNITPNDTGPDQNFIPVSSYEAARASSAARFVSSRPLRGPSHDPENLTLLGDFWDDLFHFAEDVFHAIATGVLEVISVATDVANGIIELSVQLANGAAQAVQYLVHTIDDVAHAIESAFQWLAAKVEMVINWLKELFSWSDIVNTGKVLAHYIQQLLSAGSAYLTPTSSGSSPLQQLIDGQLVALTQQISAALTSLAGDSRSISDLAPSPSSLQPPAGVVSANSGNQARTNYAQRHTQNYVQNGGVIAAGAAISAALGSYTAQVISTSQSQAVSNATNGFQGNLGSVFSDPSAFFGTLLKDLVNLVNDLVVAVMDVAKGIADLLVQIAAEAVSAMQSLLETPLDIPILSWLFQELTDEPLTLLNLMSLIFAIPATIVYKVVNGTAPYDPATISTYLNATWTFPPIGAGVDAGRLGVQPPTDGFGGFAMLVTLFFYAVVDAVGDLVAVTVQDPGPAGTVLSVISIGLALGALAWMAPWDQFSKGASNWSGADALYVASWIVACLVAIQDIAFFGMGFTNLAKLSGLVGQIAAGFGGAVSLGFGIAFCVAAENDPSFSWVYQAASIIGPFPSLQKIAFPFLSDNPAIALVAIICAVDFIFNLTTGVMSFAEDWTSVSDERTAPIG